MQCGIQHRVTVVLFTARLPLPAAAPPMRLLPPPPRPPFQCGGELCPDIVSYNTVIKACGNAHKVDLGFKVWEALQGVLGARARRGWEGCVGIPPPKQASLHGC